MLKRARFIWPAVLVLVCGMGWISPGFSAGTPVTVSAIVIAVTPAAEGDCPKTVLFKGRIKASAPCTVQYRFLRSDGATKPIKTVLLTAGGEGIVDDTWTLGATTTGWEALEIISPAAYTSPHASFTLTCPPKPSITGVTATYAGSPSPELTFAGTNFGAIQGTRKLQVDGGPPPAYWTLYVWGDHQILYGGGIIPWEHVYQFAIVDGGSVISNVYSKRFLYKADGGPSPASGVSGSSFHIYIWGLPIPQGSLQLKMGSLACPIVNWNTSGIDAKVPALSPGTYDIYLQKGGDVVSFKYPFQVSVAMPAPKIKIK
jgi:hypothetical protein